MDVGGKDGSDDDDDDDDTGEVAEPSAKKKRVAKKDEDDVEPVFFFQPATSLVEEFMHLANARAIIDLTAGSGVWALAALEHNIPYFGVVLTEVHLKELHERLVREIKTKLTTPTSKLYMAFLATQVKTIKPKSKPKKEEKEKEKDNKETDEKDKDKDDKKKKNVKKSKKKKSSSSSSSESHSPAT